MPTNHTVHCGVPDLLWAPCSLHLDVHGFVVVPAVLSDGEIARMLGAMQRLRDDLKAAQRAALEPSSSDGRQRCSPGGSGTDESSVKVRNCRMTNYRKSPHKQHFMHILESDPSMLEYLCHPKMVAMAEELVGGSVRLEESEASMNRREPDFDADAQPRYGFHAGSLPDVATYTANGLYHATFVKTLTNLTALGVGDGGTTVIPGSHKVSVQDRQAVIDAAYGDPDNLIYTVVAPPGSTLLFGEALIHATGQIRTENKRCVVIGGYTPPQFQAWQGQEPSEMFIASAPIFLRPLLSGGDKWSWRRRARELGNDIAEPLSGNTPRNKKRAAL